MKTYITIGILSILLVGCFSVKTDNPEKAWKYWAGGDVPDHIELIKGEYYQSPHFSLEYELFLKFKTDKKWFGQFVAYNKLELDTTGKDWTLWTKLPEWFKPDGDHQKYSFDQTNDFERSRYFFNSKTGETYIYETVGM